MDLIDSLAYCEQIALPPVGGWGSFSDEKYNIPIAGAL